MNNKQIVKIQELNRQANFIMNVQGLEEQRDENGITVNSLDIFEEIDTLFYYHLSLDDRDKALEKLESVKTTLDEVFEIIKNKVKKIK